jgi:peptidoglycan DL-endopeptidase CwlO
VNRRLLRTFLFGLLAATLLAGLAATTVASASPLSEKRTRLREVQARLDEVGMKVEKAVERFNQAASRLQTVRVRIGQNREQLEAARRSLALANRQLSKRAESIYKAPQTGLVDVLLSSRSFGDLVSGLAFMERLGNSDVDLVKSVAAFERDVKDRRAALRADESAAAGLLADRRAQKREILITETHMRELESGLEADIAQALAAQRAAARAAARQAAAAAAAGAGRASTASGGSGTWGGGSGSSGGGAPTVDPGGAGHPEVVAITQRYLGIPYLWGGASPRTGFDCSGLVMYVYAQVGIQLSHGATDQQRASKPVPLSALRPGDLVFYGDASYSYHVAIYVGGGQVIEAPRTGSVVSYDGVDDAWIGGRF